MPKLKRVLDWYSTEGIQFVGRRLNNCPEIRPIEHWAIMKRKLLVGKGKAYSIRESDAENMGEYLCYNLKSGCAEVDGRDKAEGAIVGQG